MKKNHVGLVTAWGECGMGYIAKNWIHTFNKHPDKIDYQIFSRAQRWLTPFRWHDKNVIEGPEDMDIDVPVFWNWIETFKPDVILFQDQNAYGKTKMRKETEKLRKLGIKLINYPDWILKSGLEEHRGLYDVNLAHVKRNYEWIKDASLENPVYIKWGVILKNFPFKERNPGEIVRFYINLGSGGAHKGYHLIPDALEKLKGNFFRRLLSPKKRKYEFAASAQERSENRIKKRFLKYFKRNPNCKIIFKTADNTKGGLFSLGDVYICPSLYEGVGLTITEAMATGMPVVTTDYPTMNEWLTDNIEGRLIQPKKFSGGRTTYFTKAIADTSRLAEIIIDYIEHPEKVREHSLNARRKVETDYNWDDRDEEILSLLQ